MERSLPWRRCVECGQSHDAIYRFGGSRVYACLNCYRVEDVARQFTDLVGGGGLPRATAPGTGDNPAHRARPARAPAPLVAR